MFGMRVNVTSSNNDVCLDMKEYEDRYVIYGKLPGTNINDININYNNPYLTISARSTQSVSNNGTGCIFVCKQSNNILKSFYIPDLDIEKLTGSFDGLNLTITGEKFSSNCEVIELCDNGEIIDVDYISE